MSKRDTLHDLKEIIRTMSPSEKRYIQLLANPLRHHVYIQLIVYIEKNPLQEVPKLFKQFHPNSSLEMARKHAYKFLLEGLTQFFSETEPEIELFQKQSRCIVLFRKGLLHLCLKELKSTYQLAVRLEQPLVQIWCMQLEKEIISDQGYLLKNEENLLEISNRIQFLLQEKIYAERQNNLRHILNLRFTKKGYADTQRQKTQLNDLLLEEFNIQNQTKSQSFEVIRDHLLFQAGYFKMTNNVYAASKIYKELFHLYESSTSLLHQNENDFLRMAQQALIELFVLRLFETMSTILFMLRNKKKQLFREKFYCEQIEYFNQLLLLYARSDEEAARHAVEERRLHDFKKNAPTDAKFFMYSLILIYVFLKKYQKALLFINDLLQCKPSVEGTQSVQTERLLIICIHLILNNIDVVDYELRSILRQIPVKKIESSFAKAFIMALKQYISKNDPTALCEVWCKNCTPSDLRIKSFLPLRECLEIFKGRYKSISHSYDNLEDR